MTELDSRIHPKLSDTVIARLRSRKISTVVEFVQEDPEKLMKFAELSYKDILELKHHILDMFGGVVQKPSELLKVEQDNIVCTDIRSVDELLNGGLYPGQIYELCGISSSGKTQICLTIAANVVVQSNCIVRYVDTKRDFSASRVEEILTNKCCDQKVINDAMSKIKVSCVHNMRQLFKALRHFVHTLKTEQSSIKTKVIIVDSLPAIIFKFWNEHDSTCSLNQLSNIIRYIAAEFRLSVITTNLITQWIPTPEDQSTSKRTTEATVPITPLLGNYWSYIPNTRLLLEKVTDVDRKVTVWKSYQLKIGTKCNIRITGAGVI